MKKNIRMRIALPVTLIILCSTGAAFAQRGGPPPGPDPYARAPNYDGRQPPPDPYDRGPAYPRDRTEAVYAIQAERTGVRIRVSSNGCTRKQDFRLQVARSDPARITLERRTPDRCRSFAMGSAWLTFSYAELRISARDPFVLTNPLTAWTGPGN